MNNIKCMLIAFLFIFISCRQVEEPKTTTRIKSVQKKHTIVKPNCGCVKDSLITEYTTDCDTVTLKNQSKLYYQFNCDSIWLTLEQKNGLKKILYQEKENFKQYYGIQYRLKYFLSKEYKNTVLFRSGCPANGPCNFVLVDKNTGVLKRQLGELIYEHDPRTFYDFIIYFSNDYKSITVEFVDTGRKIKTNVKKEDFNAIIPEYQFDKIKYTNGIITLGYNGNKVIIINTNKT